MGGVTGREAEDEVGAGGGDATFEGTGGVTDGVEGLLEEDVDW